MLQELARYAERKRLPGLPGYKTKRIRWIIVLTEDGQFVEVTEMQRGPDEFVCPHLEQGELVSGKTARSHFLVESAAVMTGYGTEEGDTKRSEKRRCFVQLLHQAATACPELELAAQTLENQQVVEQINATLEARKAKPTDNTTFRVGTQLVVDLPTWQAWWQNYRLSLGGGSDGIDPMVCLLTGDVASPIPTHAKVSGLARVGGQPSGSTLISFDKEAFASYGLSQSTNAACSETAVALYRSALDHLVAEASAPLGGALLLHWYSEPIKEEDDPFADLMSFGEESEEARAMSRARELLTAIRTGKRPELTRNRYFVLQVSGSGGRVMVRDWFTGDFVRLVENINAWYDDLEIVKPHGNENAEPPRLDYLLTRLNSFRPGEENRVTFTRMREDKDKQLAPLVPQMWRTILEGRPLPDAAAQHALAYTRSRLMREDDKQRKLNDGNLDRVACAVLKVWFNRKVQLKSDGKTLIMEARMNKDHPAAAYHIGRVVAVFAKLQRDALGKVDSGVVQRFFASASTTPALVLYRLVRNAQYHLDKIDDKGLVIWYERQIAEIVTKLGDNVPSTLDLEGQTLFTLGYYQQQAELYRSKKIGDTSIQANEGGN